MRKGEPECLAYFVKQLPPKARILEIGTFRGLSAALMAKQRKDIHIDTLDPHIGIPEEPHLHSSVPEVLANFHKHGVFDQICHLPISSRDFNPKHKYDMLFIDGDHTYAGVSHDYLNFEPFVKEGGFIIFHDYGYHEGVTKFCKTLNFSRVFRRASLLIVKK